MAKNLSIEADKIKDYFTRGMDQGAEPIIHSLPVLFKRIEELERALIPFARVGLVEKGDLPLVNVYYKDCKNAFDSLSERNAVQLQKPEEFIPAEHV